MRPDVTTVLREGLGNQLFQYAATVRALRETGGSTVELLLAEPEFRPNLTDMIRVPARGVTRRDRARWASLADAAGPGRRVFRRTARLYESRVETVHPPEPFTPFRPISGGRPLKLEGHFQHPTWFVDDWRTVVDRLLASAPTGYTELIAKRQTVINLRHRGDYSNLGWALPPDHYRSVFAELDRLVGDERTVVVVADEDSFVAWFTEFAGAHGFNVVAPQPLTGRRAIDDFWTIAAASVVAIANSTFSWWAGAVATARGETQVIYPRPWLINSWSALPVPDMGLPGWIAQPSGLPEFG